MTIKNSVAAVGAIALLAVGYIGGAYIGLPQTDEDKLSGNIGKAISDDDDNDPDLLALQEALKTDTALQQKAVLSAIILSSKISDIDGIVEASLQATDGVKVLANANKDMLSLQKKVAKAKEAEQDYFNATAKLIAGDKVDGYEDICSKALLAYTILDNKLDACRDDIDLFAAYLEEADDSKVQKAFSLWMDYCAEDAVLRNDDSAIKYWKNSLAGMEDKKPTLSASIDKAIEACKQETKDENIIRILSQLSGRKIEAQQSHASVMKQCEQMLVSGK